MENEEDNRNSSRNQNNNKKLYNHQTSIGSMSDTESQTSQMDSFHSPLRSESPLNSDNPFLSPPPKSPSKAIVSIDKDKYYSPLRSPLGNHQYQHQKPAAISPPAKAPSPVLAYNRSVREELASGVTKMGPTGVVEGHSGGRSVEDGRGVGGERRSRAAVASELTVTRAALGFRVCEVILCLISFSVMAADRTQGWSGDSFDRYKEYRYCLAVTVIGFVYSGFQAFDLAYNLISGKHALSYNFRYHFDFLMDQILAYLLISASSSAATRVVNWVSNWGKDEFTEMASASVGMSFLAFVAFALSSLISGYNFCNRNTA